MTNLMYGTESYAIRGCAMRFHKEMGSGFLEAVFQECMEIKLAASGIEFTAHAELQLHLKGRALRKKYVADFVCFQKIVVELKTVRAITEVESAQVLNYLKATGFRLALNINFNPNGKLEFERVVL